MPATMTYSEVADLLEAIANGRSEQWDWDDYMSVVVFSDPYLQEVQRRMTFLDTEYPAEGGEGFCSEEGQRVMRVKLKS